MDGPLRRGQAVEADEGAVSEEDYEGQEGDEFVHLAEEMCAWWTVLHQGALGKAERGVRGGWEMECAPYLGIGIRFKRDEATWEAILEEVLAFMRTNGRFPKCSGDTNERRLYNWLRNNADTTSSYWTRARHDKLIAALGELWQSECLPKSIHDQ